MRLTNHAMPRIHAFFQVTVITIPLYLSRTSSTTLSTPVVHRSQPNAAQVGSRLLESTGGGHDGHRVYPLVIHAQKRLCSLASRLLSGREQRLKVLDDEFHAAQAKKRSRKVGGLYSPGLLIWEGLILLR